MSATGWPKEPAWQQHPSRRFRPTSLRQFGQLCRRHEHPRGERTPVCLLQSCLLCLHNHPTNRDCTPTTPTVPAHPAHQPPGRSGRAAFNPCHASLHTRLSPPIPVSTENITPPQQRPHATRHLPPHHFIPTATTPTYPSNAHSPHPPPPPLQTSAKNPPTRSPAGSSERQRGAVGWAVKSSVISSWFVDIEASEITGAMGACWGRAWSAPQSELNYILHYRGWVIGALQSRTPAGFS